MKCYNHHDRDAFGICRICGKGLCLECMEHDKEHGIYCKDNDECKTRAAFVNKNIKNQKLFFSILLIFVILFILKIIF